MSERQSNADGNGSNGYDAAWAQAVHEVSLANLEGLKVRCPSCHRAGTLVSKWEPKTPVKPLFIVHTNGNGHFKSCPLNEEEADAARRKVAFGPDDIVKTFRLGRTFVLFSGGKDSVATLLHLTKLAKREGIKIAALHANTTAGFPEVERYVEEICGLLDVELVTVHPAHDYFEIAKKWGIPGFKSRWCCETLKIAPMRRFLATQGQPRIIYDGIRNAESNQRAKYVPVWFHPSFRCLSVSPILHWSDEDVERCIASSELPDSPTKTLGTSGECWCGAYKSRSDFEALLEVHPEIFAKLVEVEEAQKGTYTFLYENGKQIPLSSLLQDGAGS